MSLGVTCACVLRVRLVLALVVVGLAAPIARASAQDPTRPDTLFRLSLVAAVAGHGADLASTEYCLGAGRCREGNPYLARFDSPVAFGMVKMGIAGVSLWMTGKLHASHPRMATAVNLVMAGGFVALGLRNARVAGRASPAARPRD